MPRDYYDILGVSKKADDAAIKKAYRKLAKKYHPDVNKEPGAKERFNEAQEAYDVLSDSEKRGLYDQFGHAGVGAGGPGGGHAHGFHTGPGGATVDFGQGGFNVDDLFNQFFGAGGGGRRGPGGPGGMGGMGGMGGGMGGGRPRPRKGQDLHHTVNVTFDTAVHGGSTSLRLQGAGGAESVDVKVPKGVETGAKLRLRGRGHPSPNGGAPGDLILTIHVGNHPWFTRKGLDLYVDLPISIDEAVFGAEVEAPTLNGKATVKIPAGATTGQKLRLRDAGMEDAKGAKGNLYVVLKVDVPSDLTDEQRQLFEGLKGKLPDARRDVGW
ncbi:MAG: DnaJ C-terminal domain-containing protein [Planctomycetota bacterium]|jgi:DnaJ-class molecular chaperone